MKAKESKGICVINHSHKIVYMDRALKTFFSEDCEKKVCFEIMRGNKEICSDCPLKGWPSEQTTLENQLMYNQKLGVWIEYTMLRISWPGEGPCILFIIEPIIDNNHEVAVSFKQKLHYEVLFEFSIENNSYRMFCKNELILTRICDTGNLDILLDYVREHWIFLEDRSAFQAFMNVDTLPSRLEKKGYVFLDIRLLQKNFSYKEFTLYVCRNLDVEKNKPFSCYVVSLDTSQLLRQQGNKSFFQKMYDPLTGLYSKDSFEELVEQQLLKSGSNQYSMIVVDIEHFKLFNSWYGVEMGDKLLIYIAEQLKKMVKKRGGIAARIGGDDFAVFLPTKINTVTDLEKELNRWVQGYDSTARFLPGMGIYYLQEKDLSVMTMCDRAIIALEAVKGNYVHRVALYNDIIRKRAENDQEIFFNIKQGLRKKEFEIFFQPMCSARTQKIISAEALVRWNHPQKGRLMPSDFIPVLESTGYIFELDYFVWETVCVHLHNRIKQNLPVIPISVNVSRIDIFQYDLAVIFKDLIKKYDLKPQLLEIEITESAYTENYDQLVRTVSVLREAGFTLLMDDFGSGYSSLNMLKDIEIDVLKIDMKFLSMTEQSQIKGTSILESVIRMGKWLNLRLIAEGVETAEQVNTLLSLDCEYMQGYHFYQPMDKTAFCLLLDQEERIDPRGILARRMPSINLQDLFYKDITSNAMLNNILGGFAVYEVTDDQQMTIMMVNDQYYRMTGCNPVDLYEKRPVIAEQIHPEDLSVFWDIFKRAEKANTFGASGIFRRYRLNGKIMWMNLHVYFLRKNGNKKLFCCRVTDVSENVRIQKELITVLDTTPGDIVEYRVDDKDVTKKVMSAGLADAHGYSKEIYRNCLMKDDWVNTLVSPKDRERVRDLLVHPET